MKKDIRFDGVIEPVFHIAELLAKVDTSKDAMQAEQLVTQKLVQGQKDVETLFLNKLRHAQRPRLMLVYGVTSIVAADVAEALGTARAYYDIQEQRINIQDEQAILGTLNHFKDADYDAVAFVRGGGPGVEIFDQISIAKAALDVRPVLLTAIGHAQDFMLLERIADKRFTTPTALGAYLADLVKMMLAPTVPQSDHDGLTETARTQNQPAILYAIIVVLLVIIVFFLMP